MNPSCLVIRFLTLSAVLVVLVGLQPALAQDQPRRPSPIGAGKTLNGELAPGEILDFELDAAEGDYVRGNITGDGVTLSLVDQTGKRERLLGRGTGEQEAFHFMVGSGGPWRLQVQAKVAGTYQLEIQSIIPKQEQIPPPDLPESPRLRALIRTLADGGDTGQFWREVKQQGAPIVENDGVVPPLTEGEVLITFLWRGAKHRVHVFAAPSGNHDEMHRLGESDVWYASYRVPRTARIGYKLAPDVPQLNAPFWARRRAILATAQLDPLNPHSFPEKPVDKYEGESVVELPDAPKQPWLEARADVPAGTVENHHFNSSILGNTRNLLLYRPEGYRAGADGNCLLVLFDGEKYIDEVGAPRILDHLIAAGKIPSTAAILIGNPSSATRSAELPCNPEFARFLAEELMPWADEQGVKVEPSKTVVAGASFGGLAAAYAGLKHPELFGNVYSQSGSFWWSPGAKPGSRQTNPEWLTRQFVDAPVQPVKFHLEAGFFEDHGDTSILRSTRHLRDVLKAKGYTVQHNEYASGHGYFYWRYTLPNGLIQLLGQPSEGASKP